LRQWTPERLAESAGRPCGGGVGRGGGGVWQPALAVARRCVGRQGWAASVDEKPDGRGSLGSDRLWDGVRDGESPGGGGWQFGPGETAMGFGPGAVQAETGEDCGGNRLCAMACGMVRRDRGKGGDEMASERVLRRLLRLRELEEEQSRLTLEAAARKRDPVASEMDSAMARCAKGRGEMMRGVGTRDALVRFAGIEEMAIGEVRRERLRARAEDAERELARQREEFLERRTGRMQVETLAGEAALAAQAEADRRAQQMLDDWFGQRRGARLSSAAAGRRGERKPEGAGNDI